MKGCAGDVAWLPSHHMPDPFPSRSHDDGAHAVLVTAGEKMTYKEWLKNLCCKLWLCVEAVLSCGFSVFEGSDGCHDFFFLWWFGADI